MDFSALILTLTGVVTSILLTAVSIVRARNPENLGSTRALYCLVALIVAMTCITGSLDLKDYPLKIRLMAIASLLLVIILALRYFLSQLSKTQEKEILMPNEPTENSNQTNAPSYTKQTRTGWTVRNLTIRDCGGAGIRLNGSSGNSFHNVVIDGTGDDGIVPNDAHGNTFDGVKMSNTGLNSKKP